jgi:hypothetical protein
VAWTAPERRERTTYGAYAKSPHNIFYSRDHVRVRSVARECYELIPTVIRERRGFTLKGYRGFNVNAYGTLSA